MSERIEQEKNLHLVRIEKQLTANKNNEAEIEVLKLKQDELQKQIMIARSLAERLIMKLRIL
jgi:hypothetical protein